MSTVTRISGVRVAILVTVDAFELSDQFRSCHVVSCSGLLCLACECGAINMSGGVGGGAAPPICKTSNRMAKRHFLLSLAKICLLRSCQKNERGLCKTSSKMRTLFAELCYVLREHVVSCSALLCLACECGAINMSGGVGGGAAPPICKTSNRTAKRYFLQKNERGVGGGAAPPPPFAKHLIR